MTETKTEKGNAYRIISDNTGETFGIIKNVISVDISDKGVVLLGEQNLLLAFFPLKGFVLEILE